MSPKLSIIICTHNPRENYLHRVLDALRAQTLPYEQWELILIDNASDTSLATRFDLTWHPLGRHIHEEELGLTRARLRGINESNGDILVFVDDDTVLDADYLEEVLVVGDQRPFIGAWGGNVEPEFEINPPDWIGDQAWRLTIFPVKEDVWSNLRETFETIPLGAGMCLRRSVARHFVERCRINGGSNELGRKGAELSGYEDVDMAYCALDIGLGTGRFKKLRLTHLIPASRLTLDYFIRHAEGDAKSSMMFRVVRGLSLKNPRQTPLIKIWSSFRRLISPLPRERLKIQEAHQRGLERGYEMAQEYLRKHPIAA